MKGILGDRYNVSEFQNNGKMSKSLYSGYPALVFSQGEGLVWGLW